MRQLRPSAANDREILRLAIPAFGALAAEPLYVLADTATPYDFMLSRYLAKRNRP